MIGMDHDSDHTKDKDVAACLLDGVLAMDRTRSGLVVLDRNKLDQLRILQLGNRLFLAEGRLCGGRQGSLTRALLVSFQPVGSLRFLQVLIAAT